MANKYFELVSEASMVTRRSFPTADPTILNPNGAQPLLQGEFLEIDTNYNAVRGAAGSGVHEGQNPAYPVYTEIGRTDTQILGQASLIWLHEFEARTQIFTATSLVVGSALTVQDVTIGGITRRGLALASGSGTAHVMGFVTIVNDGTTGGLQWMRFIRAGRGVLK
jgi:hypothetical protein